MAIITRHSKGILQDRITIILILTLWRIVEWSPCLYRMDLNKRMRCMPILHLAVTPYRSNSSSRTLNKYQPQRLTILPQFPDFSGR